MKFRSEVDLRTGKRFFNPQQDIVDRGIGRYEKSIRRFQDLMAFFYFSYFTSTEEKKEICRTITGLENMREILVGNIGYHPDDSRPLPAQDDYQALVRASRISRNHSVLRVRYHMRQFFHREDMSYRITMQLKGGPYFQKWQREQNERGN